LTFYFHVKRKQLFVLKTLGVVKVSIIWELLRKIDNCITSVPRS